MTETEPQAVPPLRESLLEIDSVEPAAYEEYRMNLEHALRRTKRFDRIAFHAFWISFFLAFLLMFAGGNRTFGSFDPWSTSANPLSITLGVIYVVANIIWPLAIAASLSRFQPRIRKLRQQTSDAKIDQLQHEVAELRRQLQRRNDDSPPQR